MQAHQPFQPFQDETSSYQLDELTFENQGERLSIYGRLQITLDKQGLLLAQELQRILHDTVDFLQQQNLPDKLSKAEQSEEIDNPFWKR